MNTFLHLESPNQRLIGTFAPDKAKRAVDFFFSQERYPHTAAVQAWIDAQIPLGLVDFKVSVTRGEGLTVETLSISVMELLTAPAMPGVKLD